LDTVILVDRIDQTALVNKDVIAGIAGLDKTETFGGVKEFDYAFFHDYWKFNWFSWIDAEGVEGVGFWQQLGRLFQR
jgi:hypothetical protein